MWNDIFLAIGDLPIRLVLAPKLLDVLNKVEERDAIETAPPPPARVDAALQRVLIKCAGRDRPVTWIEVRDLRRT